jgi:hypothetical protein
VSIKIFINTKLKAKNINLLCISFVFPCSTFPTFSPFKRPKLKTNHPTTSIKMKAAVATTLLALTATAVSARPSRSRLSARQTTCLLDTVSNPDSTDIENAINQWASDVSTVNNYLNIVQEGGFSDPNDLLAATQAIFITASDEPCQFQTLKNNPDAQGDNVVPKFACAISDLDGIFGTGVLDNLNAIIADPSNTDTVTNAVASINIARCCNVLPDVDTLFLDSATDFGIANLVPLSVPRENACANIECTPACAGLDNGSAGGATPSASAVPSAAPSAVASAAPSAAAPSGARKL